MAGEARAGGANLAHPRRARGREGPARRHGAGGRGGPARSPRCASAWQGWTGPQDEALIRGILRRLGHRDAVRVANDAVIALVAGAPETPGPRDPRGDGLHRLRRRRAGADGPLRGTRVDPGRRGLGPVAGPRGAARRGARGRRARTADGALRPLPRSLEGGGRLRPGRPRSTDRPRARASWGGWPGRWRPPPRRATRWRRGSSIWARRSWLVAARAVHERLVFAEGVGARGPGRRGVPRLSQPGRPPG